MMDESKTDKEKDRSRSDHGPAVLEGNFLDYQVFVANEAIHRLWQKALKLKRKKGKSDKRVHNMRVAFRRWYSIWNVLSEEGFDSKSFKKKVGKKLKQAYKLLGAVRDWDVNLNTGQEYGVAEQVLAKWQHERNRVEEEAFAGLKRLKLVKLIKKLSEHIKKRSDKLRKKQGTLGHFNARPRDAIESYLRQTESQTRYLAYNAASLEELHALRLKIKAWRYILVEFYGYSAEPLVQAQQILGQINDLERVRVLLLNEDSALAEKSIGTVVAKQQELIARIDEIKLSLPFGLRPINPSD